MSFFVGLVRNVFILAVKLSIPVVAVIFLSNVGLGVVARTVPQINVFIVGFPLHIAIGLIFLGLTMPLGGMLLQNAYGDLSRSGYTLLKVMK
jgi:flagellar biosynthetic protein FliR